MAYVMTVAKLPIEQLRQRLAPFNPKGQCAGGSWDECAPWSAWRSCGTAWPRSPNASLGNASLASWQLMADPMWRPW
jgi:hypothetical protein